MDKKYSILIVDDNADLADSLRDVLEIEGYNIAVANDGQTAIALNEKNDFDFAIVDISLPGMSGIELIKKLAELSSRAECILITGYASLDSAIDAVKQRNIVGYLTKPLNIEYLTLLTRQVIERKQAERKHPKSEQELEILLQTMPAKVFYKDTSYRYSRVNQAFAQFFNKTPQEIIGKTFEDFTPWPSIAAQVKSSDSKVIETGEAQEITWNHSQLPEDSAWQYENKLPVMDNQGRIVGILGIITNISAVVKAADEKLKLERRVQLTSRLTSVGQMASGIAHEINNPLTGVVGFSKMLLDKGGWPEEVQAQLEIINTGANRITEIVKRMLIFARQQKPEQKLADINEIIESCLALRKYELDTGNIKLIRHLDPELPMSVVDAGQLQDVFMNIIVNAEKAMRQADKGGKLDIRTEAIDDTIRISITDDGPGIAEENLDKIFNPFFTTREVGEGTGLGLSLSYSIIQEHHGKIYAESELGKGATFFIELPIIAVVKGEERPVKPVEESKTTTRAKILVIDDEPTILLLLREFLVREGHEVETVNNCQDALERARVNRYGLILCDVMMPGMSGIQLYRTVMEEIPSLARRFIFITGDIIGAETMHFLSETGLPYLTKPFDLVEVKNTINHSLTAAG